MKSSLQQIAKIIEPDPVTKGAGVKLQRSIGTEVRDYLHPLPLLDHLVPIQQAPAKVSDYVCTRDYSS